MDKSRSLVEERIRHVLPQESCLGLLVTGTEPTLVPIGVVWVLVFSALVDIRCWREAGS